MTNHFYRKSVRRAITAIVAIFLTVTTCTAQEPGQTRTSSARKPHRGPRALAVIEFLPTGKVRLVPIALWIDGRYYDASLYAANPEPMAVEPDTVYEAQSFGEPTGIFTVTQPRQVNGNWIADGTWRPHLPMDEKAAADAKKAAADKAKNPPSKTVFTGETDGNRPVLKRAPGSGGDSSSSSQPSQSAPGNDSDRPVMQRAPSDSNSPANADDNDPNRPVMHRASTSSSAPSQPSPAANPDSAAITQSAASSDDSDPNRPTLSRNKPSHPQPVADLPSPKTEAPFIATAKGAKSYPAISDAGTYQGRPMLYNISPGERKAQQDQVAQIALDEIRNFAAKHHGPAIPRTATIIDYDARSFDLDYSSSPTIVLSTKLPATLAKAGSSPDLTYFATVVAKIDINGQAQKIFSMVTDSHHLDAYPRMELIDAVDADANGRGDLLFREYSDVGIKYSLYRVSPYQLDQIFEGGSSL